MPDKNPFMATEVVAQAASPGKPKKLLEQVRDAALTEAAKSGKLTANGSNETINADRHARYLLRR